MNELPSEIIITVLSKCDPRSMINFNQVSKLYKKLLNEQSTLNILKNHFDIISDCDTLNDLILKYYIIHTSDLLKYKLMIIINNTNVVNDIVEYIKMFPPANRYTLVENLFKTSIKYNKIIILKDLLNKVPHYAFYPYEFEKFKNNPSIIKSCITYCHVLNNKQMKNIILNYIDEKFENNDITPRFWNK
jgi:hypothetical protein